MKDLQDFIDSLSDSKLHELKTTLFLTELRKSRQKNPDYQYLVCLMVSIYTAEKGDVIPNEDFTEDLLVSIWQIFKSSVDWEVHVRLGIYYRKGRFSLVNGNRAKFKSTDNTETVF